MGQYIAWIQVDFVATPIGSYAEQIALGCPNQNEFKLVPHPSPGVEFLSLLPSYLKGSHEETIVGKFESNHRVGHALDFVKIIDNIPDAFEVLCIK